MIMNKKDLMNMSARITPDIQGRLIGLIADYLKDNGGSLDMDFHMQVASYDNFEEDDRPLVAVVSRIFLEGDQVCLSASENGEGQELWYMREYLTIDEILALIRYIYINPKLN